MTKNKPAVRILTAICSALRLCAGLDYILAISAKVTTTATPRVFVTAAP
jgi:hypothetical protein